MHFILSEGSLQQKKDHYVQAKFFFISVNKFMYFWKRFLKYSKHSYKNLFKKLNGTNELT